MAAKVVKKTGKENAPPAKSRRPDTSMDVDDDELAGEGDAPAKGSARATDAVGGGVQKRLDAMTAERNRLRTQNAAISKQFDDLSNLRSSDSEKLFEAYKEKSETRSAAQNDVIASLTALNDKLQARIQALEKAAKADLPPAGGVFGEQMPAAKADPREVRALKDKLAKMEGDLRSKSKECDQLDKMYKDELERSKLLASSSRNAGAPAVSVEASSGNTQEDSLKDQAIIRTYEDITDLAVLDVKVKDGKFGPKSKEYILNCIQTVGKHTANFKLRTFLKADPTLIAAKAKNPYVKTFEFTPNFQVGGDAALLERLKDYSQAFEAPVHQLGEMLESFRACMAEEADEAG